MGRIGKGKGNGGGKKPGRKSNASQVSDTPEEEEYEVESILSHKRSKDLLEYFVSWVGFPGELTWIPEDNAKGMPEIVENYWATTVDPSKKHERFPEDSAESEAAKETAQDSRKKITNGTPTPLSTSSNKKKRSQQDDKGEDEQPSSAAKSKAKSSGYPSNSKENALKNKRRKRSPSPKLVTLTKAVEPVESELDDESTSADNETVDGYLLGRTVSSLDEHFRDRKSWEDLVAKVETVDKGDDEMKFMIVWKQDDSVSWVPSTIARTKCPQKIIDFYESHLKFTIEPSS
ncbi:hypothetical protein OIO90_003100 [Microbotryomycetes sp. JL221]|nr:hypothetical protein OIO90_003100 [Microbotryomycetes sp. JL221]